LKSALQKARQQLADVQTALSEKEAAASKRSALAQLSRHTQERKMKRLQDELEALTKNGRKVGDSFSMSACLNCLIRVFCSLLLIFYIRSNVHTFIDLSPCHHISFYSICICMHPLCYM
jgi:hypothetical protein